MAEKPEDLNLPNSVVFRLIKESIPAGTNVSKDVRLAISKAASVFVLYCTATANAVAQTTNRKTLTGGDVLAAMEEMEFEEFRPILQAFLQEYKDNNASKKQRKSPNQKQQQSSGKSSGNRSGSGGGTPSKAKQSPGKRKSPGGKDVALKPLTVAVDSRDGSEDSGSEDVPLARPGPSSKERLSRQSSGGPREAARMEVDEEDVVVLD